MIRYGTNPIVWSNGDDRTPGAHISPARRLALRVGSVRREIVMQMRDEGLSFLEGVRRAVFTMPGDQEGAVVFPTTARIAWEAGCDGWPAIDPGQDPAMREPKVQRAAGPAALGRMARLGRAP